MTISEIYYPESIGAALKLLREYPDTLLLAGGTGVTGSAHDRALVLPPKVACISRLPELRKTIRTEQFLETGSCTTLTGLLSLAGGSIPEPLPDIIAGIAHRAVRNIATLGGNICAKDRFMDLWPFLACMDTQIEIRSSSDTFWASISHLAGKDGRPSFPEASILSRVRIPHHRLNFIYYRQLGKCFRPGGDMASLVCMADIERNRLNSFRLVYAGEKAYRRKDLEITLEGRRLPVSPREIGEKAADYKEGFAGLGAGDARIFSGLLDDIFERLFI